MKKSKKLLSTIFALCLAISLVPTAFADSTGETTNATNFDDIAASDYYYEPILWAVMNSITTGTSESTFSPFSTCTRGQIITFLWRANGSPEPSSSNSFTDVSKDEYYYNAVQWAYENGIDESTGTFKPDSPCTRAMVVEYLWKLAGSPKAASEAGFTDVSSNASYANAVAWAVKQGITTGTSSTKFSPTDTCTRGQIVTFLYRNYNRTTDRIIESNVLKVGCTANVLGFGYLDVLTNEYEGLEIDIANMIADYMGIDDVEFTTVSASTCGELLNSGALDCVIATFAITDERRESWDFTTAYYTDYVSLFVEDKSGITALADLVGTTIGVISGSNSAKKLVEEMISQGIIDGSSYDSDTFDPATWTEGVSFRQYDKYPTISTGLYAGEVSAFCEKRSILASYLTSSRSYMDAEFAPQEYGIATRRGSDFSDLVEHLITTWLNDGTIKRLINKWGL